MTTLNDTQRWRAVEQRDRSFDGTFYVAVKTTGVYCRPSCSARTPKRANVAFFTTSAECEQAGYRACKRCKPNLSEDPQVALARAVAGALEQAAESTPDAMPSLAELAERFNFSPFHLQRVFKRHLGVSPKQYALGLRQKHLKQTLRRAARVTEAVYAAGYNSQSQAGVAQELGMTPTQYRNGGAPDVAYAIVECPLGLLLVAATERGICKVALGESRRALAQAVHEEYPAAHVDPEHRHLSAWVTAVLTYLRGAGPHPNLPTDVQATAFQRKVWTALRRIPAGQTRSYAQLARTIGQPTAARAVANACGANPTAIVVPCHRVIHGDGTISGYRWGVERKRQLLEIEGASAR
ncbi:MAG: bifunctional DNA-binding transcriptional regulator/O6-methylguanine-DNA methyltransferase Ada [Anaerolineales bacterium]|nr:bifunctional DNA-binding transcriptional regulator/O6-methylguanine-DNA methyltransferase Ada [Anaerolineales bacterium]